MKQGRSSLTSPRGKGKASSGKPTAANGWSFDQWPNQFGSMQIGHLLMRRGPHVSILLHTLIYVAGVSKADLARETGLTRGRIGHYLNLDEPVPEDREQQFFEILCGMMEVFEETLERIDQDQEFFLEEMHLVPEAVPVAREIVKVCHNVLANFAAAHQSKDDADADDAEAA